mmetsp:Transcript_102131/g.312373  ORF Transcript_102131/g.312373 Transcript_102131/m.312373 type:complete len:324 (+) Transcript_102131:755-1726(+)
MPVELRDEGSALVLDVRPEAVDRVGDDFRPAQRARVHDAVPGVGFAGVRRGADFHLRLRSHHAPGHFPREEVCGQRVLVPAVIAQEVADARTDEQASTILVTQAVRVDVVTLKALVISSGEDVERVGHRNTLVPVILRPIDHAVLLLLVQDHLEERPRVVPRPEAGPPPLRAELVQEMVPEVVRPREGQELPTDVILRGRRRRVQIIQSMRAPNHRDDVVDEADRVADRLHEPRVHGDDLLAQVNLLGGGVLVRVVAVLAKFRFRRPELRIESLAVLVKHEFTATLATDLGDPRRQPLDNGLRVGDVVHHYPHLPAPLAVLRL